MRDLLKKKIVVSLWLGVCPVRTGFRYYNPYNNYLRRMKHVLNIPTPRLTTWCPLSQLTEGVGTPPALHSRVALSPLTTTIRAWPTSTHGGAAVGGKGH